MPAPRTVRAAEGVFGADLTTSPGSGLHWRQGSGGRVYDIWLAGETLASLAQRKAALDDMLARTIEWEFG